MTKNHDTNAATKLVRVVENTERVLAIEKIFAHYRKVVPFIDDDRYMHPLIEASVAFLR